MQRSAFNQKVLCVSESDGTREYKKYLKTNQKIKIKNCTTVKQGQSDNGNWEPEAIRDLLHSNKYETRAVT